MFLKMPNTANQRLRNWIKELKYTINKNAKSLFYLISNIEKQRNPKTNCVKLGWVRGHQISRYQKKGEEMNKVVLLFRYLYRALSLPLPAASTKSKPTNVIRTHKLALFTIWNAMVLSWQFFNIVLVHRIQWSFLLKILCVVFRSLLQFRFASTCN